MTHRVNALVVSALFLITAATLLRADDLSDRLEREFARLASDDPGVREAATEAIAKEGPKARAAVNARIAIEKDAEVKSRLVRALEKIALGELGARKWVQAWSVRPLLAEATGRCLSPDGRFAATTGEDRRLILWDAGTGKKLWEVEGLGTSPWGGFGFTVDGSQVLWLEGHEDPQVKRWSTKDGSALPAMTATRCGKDAIVFRGADGVAMVGLSCDLCGVIGYGAWITSPAGIAALRMPMRWAAISPDGERIAVTEEPGEGQEEAAGTQDVRVWSTRTGEVLRTETLTFDAKTWRIAVAPDASAAAAIEGGQIRVVPLEGEGGPKTLGAGAVTLGWSGRELVSAHEDGKLTWWKDGAADRQATLKGNEVCRLEFAGGVMQARHRGEKGEWYSGAVSICRADTGETLESFEKGDGDATIGGTAMLATDETHVVIYAGGKRVVNQVRGPDDGPDWGGPLFIGGGRALLEVVDRVLVRTIEGGMKDIALGMHGAGVSGLVWTREGIVANASSGPALLDPADGHTIGADAKHSYEVAFGHCIDLEPVGLAGPDYRAISADGTWAAMRIEQALHVRRCDGSDAMRHFEIEQDKEPVDRGLKDGSLAFSPDGSLVAAITATEGFVDVWETKSGRRTARLGPFKFAIADVAIAAEGNTIVVATESYEDGLLLRFAPDGTALGSTDWPNYSNVDGLVVHGRWALASEYGREEKPSALVLLDLKQPAVPLVHILPGFSGISFISVHEASDGDRILVESTDGAGVFVASCSGGLLRRLQTDLFNEEACSGWVEGIHPAVVTEAGLALWHGPTLERASLDPAAAGQALSVSPDGKRVAVANGARVTVYDLR
jgi:WD40 repeat protein